MRPIGKVLTHKKKTVLLVKVETMTGAAKCLTHQTPTQLMVSNRDALFLHPNFFKKFTQKIHNIVFTP